MQRARRLEPAPQASRQLAAASRRGGLAPAARFLPAGHEQLHDHWPAHGIALQVEVIVGQAYNGRAPQEAASGVPCDLPVPTPCCRLATASAQSHSSGINKQTVAAHGTPARTRTGRPNNKYSLLLWVKGRGSGG